MKIKFPVCFRPLTLETEDHGAVIIAADSQPHSNFSVLLNHRNYPLSDKEHLRSRSSKVSSRKFCRDFKSVSVEASFQQETQRGSNKNVYPPIPRSKSHQDSIKTSKNLLCVESVDDNSMSSLHYDTTHGRSPSFNKTLSRSRPHSKSLDQPRQKFSEAKPKSWNLASCVFTMSLCVTIFCGRACAILFTSIILFYLVSRHTCIDKRLESVPRFPKTRKDYKKRIIMEGLLKRNNLNGSHSERE